MIPPEPGPDPPEPVVPLLTFDSSANGPDDSLYRAYDTVIVHPGTPQEKTYSVYVSIEDTKASAMGVFIIPKTGTSGPVGIARKSSGANVWHYKFDGVTVPSDKVVGAAFYVDWDDHEHVDDSDIPLSTLGSTTEYTWTNAD